MKNKTLQDVAEAARLSLITVSRALRTPESVREETRARVHQAIEEIGYVPNLTARSLKSRQSNIVGVVVPILSSSLFSDFAEGVTAAIQAASMQVLLGVTSRLVDKEAEAVDAFIGRQADAIIVTGYTHSEGTRRHLEAFAGPVVETWNLRPEAIDMAVGFSNFDASAEMTRYLIDKGYRDIAVVGGDFENNDQAGDRFSGFVSAMKAAGRSVRPELVIPLTTPTTIASGFSVVSALMALEKRPDAIFFHAEFPAQGAVMACHEMGISVPGDLAIAGFGDLSFSRYLPVPLTTVGIPASRIGFSAGRLVIDRLAGRKGMQSVVDEGYDIIVRRSA